MFFCVNLSEFKTKNNKSKNLTKYLVYILCILQIYINENNYIKILFLKMNNNLLIKYDSSIPKSHTLYFHSYSFPYFLTVLFFNCN